MTRFLSPPHLTVKPVSLPFVLHLILLINNQPTKINNECAARLTLVER